MIHICFSISGAQSLRGALQNIGKPEQVLHFCDDLTAGPILDICGAERKFYYLNRLDEVYWQKQLRFWQRVSEARDSELMVWMTRRNSLEMAGFSEFVSRIPKDIKFQLAEFSNESMGDRSFYRHVIGIGLIIPKQFERGFEIAQTVCAKDFKEDLQRWNQLKFENAELRAFKEGSLTSVGVDHFDHFLLENLTTEWQWAVRIVGYALGNSVGQGQTIEVGDLWLFDRLAVFQEEGRIECDGDIMEPTTKIRLPER